MNSAAGIPAHPFLTTDAFWTDCNYTSGRFGHPASADIGPKSLAELLITYVTFKDPAQMPFVYHDDVVQPFSANTPDNAFRMVVEAFPEQTAPRYMVRDRDGIYGHDFIYERVAA